MMFITSANANIILTHKCSLFLRSADNMMYRLVNLDLFYQTSFSNINILDNTDIIKSFIPHLTGI